MNAIPLAVAFNNFMSDRSGVPVDRVVIHTMVGTVASASARFGNPTAEVSAHYGVGLDGALYQWVQESDTAYHAGVWAVNLRSIGIEHEDSGDYNGIRPDALYATSAELVRDICFRHGIPIDRAHIVGHREVHATACPDALDIDRIVREAAGGSDVAQTPQEIYDAIAPLLQANIVAPQHDTNTWLKEYTDAVKAGDLAAIKVAETKIGVALERAAKAFGDSATLVEADAATTPQP